MGKLVEICPICGCEKFIHRFYGKDYFYHTNPDKKYEIIECKKCKLEMINPIPTIEEQQSFYPKDYYSYSNKSEKKSANFIAKIGQKFFSFIDDEKLNLPIGKCNGKKFLDIGCGEGINLKIMKNRGWQSEGFEIGEKGFKNNIYYGSSIINVDFSKKYDLIRCHHVFEHVYNPNEFLDKVYSLLSDDGIAIFCLPNVKGITSKIWGKYAAERDIPRHLYGYSYNNIQKLFDNHNFKIVHKNYLPNYGSFLGFQRYMYDKFHKKIDFNLFFKIIFFSLDAIFSIFKSTNSMGFILMK